MTVGHYRFIKQEPEDGSRGKVRNPMRDLRGGLGRAIWQDILQTIWSACGDAQPISGALVLEGNGELASIFPCADLALAAIASAGLAAAELVEEVWSESTEVRADRRLACLWFGSSVQPIGWVPLPVWDAIAGDYRTRDGWIKLHTNVAAHRRAALAVLGCREDRASVAAAVASWNGFELEAAIVAAGGAAAEMRSIAQWDDHPQGRAVSREPLVARSRGSVETRTLSLARPARPLEGVRVLDLTRVLAGPVATRFLAGFGAEVLRIDPPGWDEPALVAETTLGKACATLDLRTDDGRNRLLALAANADVLIHGYRPGALAALGFGDDRFDGENPGLVEVTLSAYGWSGPWRERRGYDSLVQMSCGISDAGRARSSDEAPVHLPVQALDHATGYIMACAAIRGLTRRLRTGYGEKARTSLAATARLLTNCRSGQQPGPGPLGLPDDYTGVVEPTVHGPALRLRPPLTINGVEFGWVRPAAGIGSAPCAWQRP